MTALDFSEFGEIVQKPTEAAFYSEELSVLVVASDVLTLPLGFFLEVVEVGS